MGVLGIERKAACLICDSMNMEQVQGILDSKGDRGEIEDVILSMKPQPEIDEPDDEPDDELKND